MRLAHRQLEIFHSLMQTLNVTETASLLCSSQPTISRELKELEALLGFPSFTGRTDVLNPASKQLRLTLSSSVRSSVLKKLLVQLARYAKTAFSACPSHACLLLPML